MTQLARPAALLTALALFTALGLAGCAPEEVPIPIEDGIGGEVPDVPDEDDGGDDGLTTDIGGDCLVGTWLVSDSELQGFYTAVGVNSGLELVTDGTLELTFTESSYVYVADFVFGFVLPGGAGEASGDTTGSVSGDYTVTDGVITTVHDESNLTLDAEINGMPMDLSDMENELVSEHPINSVSYHCEGGAPVINFVVPGGTHPVRLEAL